MKDPKSFVKLFDLNVPVLEHLDYYIDQMSKTQKYKDIREFSTLYKECESEIDDAYEFRKNKSEEIIEFINTLVRNEEVMHSLEQIEKIEIQRTVFDIKKFKSDFGLKKKELMVDYSGFTSEKLDEVSDSILNYLSYLSNLLGNSGPKMNYIIESDVVALLLHFKKYPELWQKLEVHSSR